MPADIQQFGLFTGKPERAKVETRRPRVRPNGYAARPGTGPQGETCGTCTHCRLRAATAGRYYKCALLLGRWTSGRTTDVLFRSPACSRWQSGTPRVTTLRGCDRAD